MRIERIKAWLEEADPRRLEELYAEADAVRRRCVGDDVHLRGLIEMSNVCARSCLYCGLRAPNTELRRYRMTDAEVLDCARRATAFGYGTVVIQAGEDPELTGERIASLVAAVKDETLLAVTLSLGERSDEELIAWRRAGADRYLLRFETSRRDLFERIHPSRPGERSDRIAMLRRLGEMGYEVGGGVMVGIPGQTFDDLARDVALFAELDLDMIGLGPFIAHPGTPLGRDAPAGEPADGQVPATEEMTYRVLALARLVQPYANIPSTTALATLNLADGRETGLARGANVVMPNVTPARYRALYEIYPAKACIRETPDHCHACMRRRIEGIGRRVGAGRGDSLVKTRRADAPEEAVHP